MDTKRGIVCGSLAENNKNPLTCRESQVAFGFAPRHAERIKLFTFDTYTKSIVEVSAIDKMNDGYMAPNVPPAPYRSYKSSLAEPAIFNVADTLRAAPFFRFPLLRYHPSTEIAKIKSCRFGSFEKTAVHKPAEAILLLYLIH